jgi:hypothetical protein
MRVGSNTTIENSTITNNIADSEGGGLITVGEVFITNTTIAFNKAGNTGGAIETGPGIMTVTNSTISNNDAENAGGGISNDNQTVVLKNTILAGNKHGNCSGDDVTSFGHNLEDANTCGFTESTDISNTDPRLGSFIDNGIPGEGYFPVLSDSPAIDKGDNDACPPLDQIGSPRFDGDGDGAVVCDIGAIEFQRLELLNGNVTFEPHPATYLFTQDTSGCPTGFVGKFGFAAQLTNVSRLKLFGLKVQVAELSNGNLLITSDGTAGTGDLFTVPAEDGYSDRLLAPGEYVDVQFNICLNNTNSFTFFVDVLGVDGGPAITFTPVEWSINLDDTDAGIHTIFMIADVRPLTEDDLQDLGGELIWDETHVTLCVDPLGISIRDVGDGFLRIGDIFQSNFQASGCDINTTMQNAFDDFGLPETACLSVRSGDLDYEFCAPLDVIQ